jgi:hypothetical protein
MSHGILLFWGVCALIGGPVGALTVIGLIAALLLWPPSEAAPYPRVLPESRGYACSFLLVSEAT